MQAVEVLDKDTVVMVEDGGVGVLNGRLVRLDAQGQPIQPSQAPLLSAGAPVVAHAAGASPVSEVNRG